MNDAVLSISTTKAATVHGTARMPRSSSAMTVSWTVARASAQSGNQRRPVPTHAPRATVTVEMTSSPAPNQA